MKIIVDNREKRSTVHKELKNLGLETEFKQLPIGDYIIGEVCVERKAAGDYVASMTDGRRENQLFQMSAQYELSYLVIEGNVMTELIEHGVPRNAYISSLAGCSLKRSPVGKQGQIVTVNVDTLYDTALFIRYLYDKIVEGKGRIMVLPKLNVSKNDVLVFALSPYMGIGEVRARSLLNEYRTLRNIFNSDDWTVIKGIGDKINFDAQRLLDMEYEGD